MHTKQSQFTLLGLTWILALGAACASGPGSTRDSVSSSSHWVNPSPLLRQQIEDEIERLPWTHGFQRLEQIRWFASVGEPGYEYLLDLIGDERDDVVAAALAALGATLDPRLVPFIRESPWSVDREQGDLNLERARTLLRLGDWSDIPVLAQGLRDERAYTRSLCIDALEEATRETLGFDAHAPVEEREQAVLRWERWWLARTGDHFLDTE